MTKAKKKQWQVTLTTQWGTDLTFIIEAPTPITKKEAIEEAYARLYLEMARKDLSDDR